MQTFQSFHLTFNCPKAFNELEPCNGGWYCDGCHKMVHDFRGMDEQQIRDAFLKNGKSVCGMYDANRISIGKKQPQLKKWLSAAMLTPGLSSLHHAVFAERIDSTINNRSKTTTVADTTDKNLVFGGVSEVMLEFPGGIEKLQKFIAGKLKTHPELKDRRAIITFIVEKDGTLNHIRVMKGINPAVDKELISVFKQSPKWHPGIWDGQPSRVQYSLPVGFKY